MHPILLEQVMKQRHEQMMNEARMIHLRTPDKNTSAGIRGKLSLKLGNLLIRVGTHLTRKYSNQMCPGTETCIK